MLYDFNLGLEDEGYLVCYTANTVLLQETGGDPMLSVSVSFGTLYSLDIYDNGFEAQFQYYTPQDGDLFIAIQHQSGATTYIETTVEQFALSYSLSPNGDITITSLYTEVLSFPQAFFDFPQFNPTTGVPVMPTGFSISFNIFEAVRGSWDENICFLWYGIPSRTYMLVLGNPNNPIQDPNRLRFEFTVPNKQGGEDPAYLSIRSNSLPFQSVQEWSIAGIRIRSGFEGGDFVTRLNSQDLLELELRYLGDAVLPILGYFPASVEFYVDNKLVFFGDLYSFDRPEFSRYSFEFEGGLTGLKEVEGLDNTNGFLRDEAYKIFYQDRRSSNPELGTMMFPNHRWFYTLERRFENDNRDISPTKKSKHTYYNLYGFLKICAERLGLKLDVLQRTYGSCMHHIRDSETDFASWFDNRVVNLDFSNFYLLDEWLFRNKIWEYDKDNPKLKDRYLNFGMRDVEDLVDVLSDLCFNLQLVMWINYEEEKLMVRCLESFINEAERIETINLDDVQELVSQRTVKDKNTSSEIAVYGIQNRERGMKTAYQAPITINGQNFTGSGFQPATVNLYSGSIEYAGKNVRQQLLGNQNFINYLEEENRSIKSSYTRYEFPYAWFISTFIDARLPEGIKNVSYPTGSQELAFRGNTPNFVQSYTDSPLLVMNETVYNASNPDRKLGIGYYMRFNYDFGWGLYKSRGKFKYNPSPNYFDFRPMPSVMYEQIRFLVDEEPVELQITVKGYRLDSKIYNLFGKKWYATSTVRDYSRCETELVLQKFTDNMEDIIP